MGGRQGQLRSYSSQRSARTSSRTQGAALGTHCPVSLRLCPPRNEVQLPLLAGELVPVGVKEGDKVLLPDYGGTSVKLEEKE